MTLQKSEALAVRNPALVEMVEALKPLLELEHCFDPTDHDDAFLFRECPSLTAGNVRKARIALSHAEAAISSAPPSVEAGRDAPVVAKVLALFEAAPWLRDSDNGVHIPIFGMPKEAQVTWAELYQLSAAPVPPQTDLPIFQAELNALLRRHGLGITGKAVLFNMEREDFAFDHIIDGDRRIVFGGKNSSPPSPAPLDVRADMLAALEPFAEEAERWVKWAAEYSVSDYELNNQTTKVKVGDLLLARDARAKGGQP